MSNTPPNFFTNAEKIKETIYGLVTLFATTIGIWLHLDDSSPLEVFVLILGTTVGLWLACFFADVLAQSITIKDKIQRNQAYKHAFDASLGILIAGRMPIVFATLALIGWVNLSVAVLASMGAILIQLVLFCFSSFYYKNNGWRTNVITVILQALFLMMIVSLKLGVK